MVVVNLARHSFSGCPCGHSQHIGTPDWEQRTSWRVACEECMAIEDREGVVIAIDTAARVGMLAIGEGSIVRCNGQQYRVASIAEITRLGGAYLTGYVRMKLREMTA